MLSKIILEIKRFFCRHRNKTIVFISYQDRYVEEKCDDCKSIIYKDL